MCLGSDVLAGKTGPGTTSTATPSKNGQRKRDKSESGIARSLGGGRGMLWLTAGIVALALVWSDDLRRLRPWRGPWGKRDSETGDAAWQLVDETAGFRTYVSRARGSNLLSIRGETIVNEHIGRLYTAFLDTNSTLDWVRFLSEVEELPLPPSKSSAAERRRLGTGGGFLFQKFDMPWPVKNREVVLQRTVQLDKHAKKMSAFYHSYDHPSRPINSAAVRAIVYRTSWELTALRGGKTAVEFETCADPKGGLPKPIVGLMQKHFPRETVAGFVKSARKQPVHKSMTKW